LHLTARAWNFLSHISCFLLGTHRFTLISYQWNVCLCFPWPTGACCLHRVSISRTCGPSALLCGGALLRSEVRAPSLHSLFVLHCYSFILCIYLITNGLLLLPELWVCWFSKFFCCCCCCLFIFQKVFRCCFRELPFSNYCCCYLQISFFPYLPAATTAIATTAAAAEY